MKEVQTYRLCFSSLCVGLTLLLSPPFFLFYFLATGGFAINDLFFALYQVVLGLILVVIALSSWLLKWELVPRGLTSPTPSGKRVYMPYSGITRAEPWPLPGFPVIRLENEAAASIMPRYCPADSPAASAASSRMSCARPCRISSDSSPIWFLRRRLRR
jgi:hypothetical protein